MATLSTAALNAVADAVVALLQSATGAVVAAPAIILENSGGSTVVASLLSNTLPTWGAASGGVALYLHGGGRANVSIASTIVRYRILSRAFVDVITNVSGVGDIGSGAEFEMDRRTTGLGKRVRFDVVSIVVTN